SLGRRDQDDPRPSICGKCGFHDLLLCAGLDSEGGQTMTAVLLWKEYRQQRAFWLAVALLALLLVLSLAETLGQGSLWQVFHDESIGIALKGVLICLSIAYGVVSGALLLAGESDEGTLVFLDNLTMRRG